MNKQMVRPSELPTSKSSPWWLSRSKDGSLKIAFLYCLMGRKVETRVTLNDIRLSIFFPPPWLTPSVSHSGSIPLLVWHVCVIRENSFFLLLSKQWKSKFTATTWSLRAGPSWFSPAWWHHRQTVRLTLIENLKSNDKSISVSRSVKWKKKNFQLRANFFLFLAETASEPNVGLREKPIVDSEDCRAQWSWKA